jgi:hypothetical protein
MITYFFIAPKSSIVQSKMTILNVFEELAPRLAVFTTSHQIKWKV